MICGGEDKNTEAMLGLQISFKKEEAFVCHESEAVGKTWGLKCLLCGDCAGAARESKTSDGSLDSASVGLVSSAEVFILVFHQDPFIRHTSKLIMH